MTESDVKKRRVVIFDRAGRDREGDLGLRERIAACYRLACHYGWCVTEVCDATERTSRAELERALTICRNVGAELLVYRAELLNPCAPMLTSPLLDASVLTRSGTC